MEQPFVPFYLIGHDRRLPRPQAFRLRSFLECIDDPTLPSFIGACASGDLTTVLRTASLRDKTDGSLNEGLYRAIEGNHADVARILLHCGVNIDEQAIRKTKSESCFQALIDYGLLRGDSEGGNLAAAMGHIITLNDERLLRWFFASQGTTPVWDESSSGLEDYFKNELERNCNKDWNADIIRWVQQSETVLETAALYTTPAVVDFLLARGASFQHSFALHAAIISIDPNRTTSDRIAMMDHILKLGADIDAIAKYHGAFQGQGGTPLHAAASHGRMEEAKWLYRHGADIMKKNRSGNLPSVECRWHGNLVMRELYLEWELEASESGYNSLLPANLHHLLI